MSASLACTALTLPRVSTYTHDGAVGAWAEADTRIGTGELNRFFRELFEVHPPPSKSGKRFKLLYATQVVPEVPRPFAPPEFLLFVNDADLITDSYREYLFNRFRERWPFPGLPIRLRLRGRETREVQDRKKTALRSTEAAEGGKEAPIALPERTKRKKPGVRLGGKAQGAKKPPKKNARFAAMKKRGEKGRSVSGGKGKPGSKTPPRAPRR